MHDQKHKVEVLDKESKERVDSGHAIALKSVQHNVSCAPAGCCSMGLELV